MCFVGDDASPPWSHASAVLAKRLIECLSPGIDTTLATLSPTSGDGQEGPKNIVKTSFAKSKGSRSLDTISLARVARDCSPDIFHLVGTNALIFSPICKLMGTQGRILRHVFTSYDRGDIVAHPVRRLVNKLFISGYAFTSSNIGLWQQDLSTKTRRFLLRPPIDCDFYRPVSRGNGSLVSSPKFRHSILYMGPLWYSRFPARAVLTALRRANEGGLGAQIVALTSESRSSPKQQEKVLSIGRELNLGDSFTLRRVDLTERDRIQAYSDADLIIFPYEGLQPERLADPPFGLLEAMACEGLVLASRALSIPEVVDDGETGFLISDATVEQIQTGLTRSLTDSRGTRIKKNARVRILKTFSYPTVRNSCLDAYRSLLN